MVIFICCNCDAEIYADDLDDVIVCPNCYEEMDLETSHDSNY